MVKLDAFLLIIFISSRRILAIAVNEWDYLDDYFDKVVDAFGRKIFDEIGVENLPVRDVSLDINRTITGDLYVGTVNYTNSKVLEIETPSAFFDGHTGGYFDEDAVHIFYQIHLPNITISSYVSANISPLSADKGSAELLFSQTTIGFYLDKNYTQGTFSVKSVPYNTEAPKTDFDPPTEVMNITARLARLELGYRLMWDQVSEWCETIFDPIFIQIVNEMDFPNAATSTTESSNE